MKSIYVVTLLSVLLLVGTILPGRAKYLECKSSEDCWGGWGGWGCCVQKYPSKEKRLGICMLWGRNGDKCYVDNPATPPAPFGQYWDYCPCDTAQGLTCQLLPAFPIGPVGFIEGECGLP